MDWFLAQDTFTADLSDHTQKRVVKGDPLPGDHELVKRDLDATAAAAKAGTDRAPLFKKLDTGEEEPAPKPSAAARAAAKVTGKPAKA
jgi:hypothetical protein